MACYEGETLRERMERGPLDLDEVLDISLQISAGLTKAHGEGVVHRDLKPANVMITGDGIAKIMDFGLAKLAGRLRITRTDTTMGTPAYMSPEQARGDDVDHRSDIWSVGVVLYEMLTGELPFKGDHEQAVIHSILNEAPARIAALRRNIPAELERVVAIALEKDRERRYQSMRTLAGEIRGSLETRSSPPDDEKSIIVLPFEDISSDKGNEYFSDGLTEEIITDLLSIQALRVISRTSALRLKGRDKDVRAIGRELTRRS